MRILKVCSGNNGISPFVKDQVKSLRKEGLTVDIFEIEGKGIIGYLKNLVPLLRKLNEQEYQLIHAHYGLSGLLANFQRKIPVVTTFHGSDIHYIFNRFLSYIASILSVYCIVTNEKQVNQLALKNNFEIIPCGIDLGLFKPMNKKKCREYFDLAKDAEIILFSSSFDRKVKNVKLAKKAVSKLEDVELIELAGYTKKEVAMLINASDVVLITSFNETGPLIAKEALACNVPIVSTDVGDVRKILGSEHCNLIAKYDPKDVANKLSKQIQSNRGNDLRKLVCKHNLRDTARKITKVYSKIV
ncbi:glycosyltransferase [Fodinibius sp. AD559]|uniref:glycosyltransferase n=1 Tax=Fodinibius sp. AD559 TaxID=3424179 RepID=UPI004046BD7F